jgi:hypothetical protein
MESMIELSTLQEDRISEAALLAARALRDNPAFADIFTSDGSAEEQAAHCEKCLHSLCYAHFSMVHLYHPEELRCGIHRDTGELLCVFVFEYPTTTYTLWQKISAGLLLLPFHLGLLTFLRLMKMSDRVDAQREKFFGKRPRIMIHRMVVNNKYQGKGIGSYCLGNSLLEADKLQLPVILDTQKPENVTFYQRL